MVNGLLCADRYLPFVVCCLSFVVVDACVGGCLLFAVNCLLLAGCWLLVVVCRSSFFAVCFNMCVVCCLVFADC